MKPIMLLAASMLLANTAVADPPAMPQEAMQRDLQRLLDAQQGLIEKNIESKLDALAEKSLQNRLEEIEDPSRATFGRRAASTKQSLQQSPDHELSRQPARFSAR